MQQALNCRLFGHKWMYKPLANSINSEGIRHGYTTVRKCKRCMHYQYKYEQWVDEKKIPASDKEEGTFYIKKHTII